MDRIPPPSRDSSPAPSPFCIVPFAPSHATAFYSLNRAWLDAHDLYEPADEAQIADPESAILAKGGVILVALASGGDVVGTAALLRHGADEAELAKLSVAERARGRGLGRRLADACVDRARAWGVCRVVLVSSSKLTPALRLYRTMGFVHRSPPAILPYANADVFMELDLGAGAEWYARRDSNPRLSDPKSDALSS